MINKEITKVEMSKLLGIRRSDFTDGLNCKFKFTM